MTAKRFIKKRIDGFTIWLAKQFVDSPLQNTFANGFRSLEKKYSLEKIPASKSADVYKFTYDDDNSRPVFYFKQYHYRSLWDIIKHAFRPSRAKRTMQAATILAANGFNSPAIVAMGCRRKGIFCVENFLLTREIENAVSIYTFFEEHYSHITSPAFLSDKKKIIKALGRLVGRLHSKNISHGDLRLGNILVRSCFNQQQATSDQQPEWDFFLLDNERTAQYARLPNRLRLKNLVQVNMFRPEYLTQTDRLRFLTAYMSENPALAANWKDWAGKVRRKTSRRLRK